ncbi:MAG: tRNA lysidine(34) synthetase TilS [Bacteroidales bacterium]|nr:tRNA lysidine(34) synthetase TilS [Bacteroidales bacterium]HOY39673.1 tRNA lysidine(34) synthetase TilS [Bacteroidales bacterium]HQP05215.1 tRNA lysidine(34) synthetase TilS [Bacteroidales bacterium]
MRKHKSNIAERISDFVTGHEIGYNARLLCAVSGGVDSVVMLEVLLKEGFKCAVAHCNFKLRGNESDGDENFVQHLTETHKLDFHVKSFATSDYALEKGVSIQMAARELRYQWFNELMNNFGYDYLALAHHADDCVETVLINLARGTGISGIAGIPEISGKMIRPMIQLRRQEILAYAKKNKIKFRIDSSNNEVKYHRNLIRHRIVPLFEQINPSFTETMLQNIEHFKAGNLLFAAASNELLHRCVRKNEEETIIEIDKIPEEAVRNGTFFSLLRELHISANASDEVIKILSGQSGKMVFDGSKQILRDRNTLIIREKAVHEETICYIENDTRFISEPVVLQIKLIHRNHLPSIPDDSKVACIDYAKISFPLSIRKWKKGDRFIPLGMSGYKKLSDFFTDNKVTRFDKENTFLLLSGTDIVWIIGMRIDERYKIAKTTEWIYLLSL